MATRKRPSEDKPESPSFKREMMRSILTEPLLSIVQERLATRKKAVAEEPLDVIFTLNNQYPSGVGAAKDELLKIIAPYVTGSTSTEVFATGTASQLMQLLTHDCAPETIAARREALGILARSAPAASLQTIYRVWRDEEVAALIQRSISTVKVNAAHRAFNAWGEGIVWAVLDTGIDSSHPHFEEFGNLDLPDPLQHLDFTTASPTEGTPLSDPSGHGTHVAGILAGALDVARLGRPVRSLSEVYDPNVEAGKWEAASMTGVVSGMAPRCKLVSMKVLDDNKRGKASNILRAIEAIQALNMNRQTPLIHGVNLSLGHTFDARWFACGHSPLCTAVNRLVKSGVAVVVAAGNSGYDTRVTASGRSVNQNIDTSINDPGNAELAITVGSTHRDMPRTYGVSYFSSRGPTADGRSKPDLLAPGERIVSCATRPKVDELLAGRAGGAADASEVLYFEDSGTSMAAPHVSGAIAAFLSVRQEFIGQPEKVKEVFLNTAVDLQRVPHFQGRGLLDLMKALMAI